MQADHALASNPVRPSAVHHHQTDGEMIMAFMYTLECGDGSYHTGSTWDLARRLQEHQSGKGGRHRAKRLPVRLVYREYIDRIEDAYHREKQVQHRSRKKKEALIARDLKTLRELSKRRTKPEAR